ncbi:MAG: hypothetical protein KDM63_10025, partial [Verrucomicrobiae bacterium]|nr:hypothetical protein [Verrucomicrobiae bacterium]
GNLNDVPEVLKDSDLSRALFGALKEQMAIPLADASAASPAGPVMREGDGPTYGGGGKPPSPPADQILAEAAIDMDRILRRHAVVRWRENVDAQNRMRNDLDDFLFALQREKGITLSFAQMDAIIEAVIRIAIHRTDDV